MIQPTPEQVFELWHTLRLTKDFENGGKYLFSTDDQVRDVIKVFEKCFSEMDLSTHPIISETLPPGTYKAAMYSNENGTVSFRVIRDGKVYEVITKPPRRI